MAQRGRKTAAVAAVLTGVLALGSPLAQADQAFHTARLPLVPVNGSGVTGTVIDVHAQGPRIYAQERYQLRSATPGTTYTVSLYASCATQPVLFGVTETLTANRAGNAVGKHTFAPAGLPAGTYYLQWVVSDVGTNTAVATTACVAVAID